MEFFKPGRTFDFMRLAWRFWIPLSFALMAISTVLMFYPGPNYGTDFRGGTEIEVAFEKPIDQGRIREAVTASGQFSDPDVVKVNAEPHPDRHFLIRVQEVTAVTDGLKETARKALCYSVDGTAPNGDEKACPANARATEVKFSQGGDKITVRYDAEPDVATIMKQIATVPNLVIRKGSTPQVISARDHRLEIQLQSRGDQLLDTLSQQLGKDTVPEQALRVEWVGPKAGKQLRDSARNAVALAIVAIMVYLAFRFDLRFAPGVVIACVHDAVVVIGVFIALHKEVTLSTVAAVLTIVGYSMNDTVVVYDRIRENLGKHRGKTFAQIINLSVSETLSRTILTSGATMLSVLAFFVWGTGVIKDFALAMVVGIVAGTYSSIYVAAPLTEWIDRKMRSRTAPAGKKGVVQGRAKAARA
jgi:preprotein translocase subunit SecF